MHQNKRQSIICTVDTCRYHGQEDHCELSSIHVSPLSGNAESAEDSMCQSFCARPDRHEIS